MGHIKSQCKFPASSIFMIDSAAPTAPVLNWPLFQYIGCKEFTAYNTLFVIATGADVRIEKTKRKRWQPSTCLQNRPIQAE